MFRRYKISIELTGEAKQTKEEVLKIFGCSVSEPSNWVEYGSSLERGLTFLDETGKELDSFVFKHQARFNTLEEKTGSEEKEIKELIHAALLEHYNIPPEEVKIKVSEYNRM
jgi:hypothetical protein